MAAENSGAKSSSAADSYIGSLISLTSKSEIRYEGILYNINTEESSIGLRNVRSFGTEGRKKDGPQVPPSDKVYEYILFRGSDIKDLQVKSSPPPQPAAPLNNDPAIIQSHYQRPVSTSTSLPSAATGPLADLGVHNTPMGLPGSNFQGALPLYQPGGNLGSWGASPPPPTANGSGLAMPMYWQGYYGPPNGLPHLQQSLLRPPPGLSVPPSLQQPMQYPILNAPLPTGPSNMQGSSLPEASSSLVPASTSSLNSASASLLTSSLPPPLPLVPSAPLATETLPSSLPNKALNPAPPAATLGASLPTISPLTTSIPELNPTIATISNKTNAIPGPVLLHQSISQSSSSIVEASTAVNIEAPTPALITPGQLLQSGPTVIPPSHSAASEHKDVEVVQVSASTSEASAPVAPEAQPPILPLPVPSRAAQKSNGAPFQSHHGYRGRERGRGTGSLCPVTRFTEDFDFIAMNEKFNKDEVWGHLGKGSNSNLKDDSDEDGFPDEGNAESQKAQTKSVYQKDDFFDTLSCNALDNGQQNGRIRFSEQLKIDTETFGDFSRHRGGRGGRGPYRGGRYRGGYYGRGYGYGNRGRGRAMSSHAP